MKLKLTMTLSFLVGLFLLVQPSLGAQGLNLNCNNLEVTLSCNESRDTANLPRPTAMADCPNGNEVIMEYEDDLSGVSECGNEGYILRKWIISDLCDNWISCAQIIYLTPEAPVIDCSSVADVTVACMDDLAILGMPTILSSCSPADQLTYTVVDDTSGLAPCGLQGVIIRTHTVTDPCGLTSTCVQTINLVPVPFAFCGEVTDKVVNCEDFPNPLQELVNWDAENKTLLLNCAQNSCEDIIEVTSDFDPTAIDEVCAPIAETAVTYTLINSCGNTNTYIGNYSIIDPIIPPVLCEDVQIQTADNQIVISELLAPISIVKVFDKDYQLVFECNNNCETVEIIADLNAGELYHIDLQLYDANWQFICIDERDIIVDGEEPTSPSCSDLQFSTESNQLKITGITAPNAIVKVFDQNYQFVFNCNGNCETSLLLENLNNGEIYHTDIQFYDVNWQFICEDKQDILIEGGDPCTSDPCETEPPVLVNIPPDMTVECDAIPYDLTDVTATDNCDEEVEIELKEEKLNIVCTDSYQLIRTYIATDNCGNSSQATQIIVVQDNTNPIFVNVPPDMTVNPDQIPPISTEVEATDNCDPDVDITVEDTIEKGSDYTTITRTYTATDNCDNTAEAEQVIIVDHSAASCPDFTINSIANALILGNLSASNTIAKVFDNNYQLIFECNANCGLNEEINDLSAGIYHIDLQFYTENWELICIAKEDITITDEVEPCDTSICLGDIAFQTQAELDAFCGCEVVNGDLVLRGEGISGGVLGQTSDIYDLSNLSQLKKVKGALVLINTSITNLDALTNLKEVEDVLVISYNSQLENLTGLSNLERIELSLSLEFNDLIEDLSDLSSLTFFRGLGLSGNFKSISSIKNIPINKLGLSLVNCDQLTSLDGLQNIDSLGSALIAANEVLTDIEDLSNVQYVEGQFIIDLNPVLSNCCAIAHLIDDDPNNGSVDGLIGISRNPEFCNSTEAIIENCQNMDNVCDNIQVSAGENIREITISNLTAPIEIVKVFDADYQLVYECFADCEETVVVAGIRGSIYHVQVDNYDENWVPICDIDETIEFDDGVSSNRNSELPILTPADFSLSPNPALTATYVDLKAVTGTAVTLKLYNQFGQEVYQKEIEKVTNATEKLEITNFSNGLYLLQIQPKGRKAIGKKLMISRLY